MKRHTRTTDYWRRVLGTDMKWGRQAPTGLRALAFAPVWIAAGALAGLAAAVLRGRRSTVSAHDTNPRVGDVMVTDVHTVDPDITVVEAAQRMWRENVGILPIVQDGRVIGVVTDRDLVVRALVKDGIDPTSMRVMDCATRDPILGRPSWTLERALLVMAEQQIGRLPVVDDNGQLVGLITLSSVALRSPKAEGAMVAAKKISSRSARAKAA
jgi:CBS domain-containing protein